MNIIVRVQILKTGREDLNLHTTRETVQKFNSKCREMDKWEFLKSGFRLLSKQIVSKNYPGYFPTI